MEAGWRGPVALVLRERTARIIVIVELTEGLLRSRHDGDCWPGGHGRLTAASASIVITGAVNQ